MEIRHTIEILTKDIQDIENLVSNLQNYEEPPLIEIDLALVRIRNLYDILLMIRDDQKSPSGIFTTQTVTTPPPVQAPAPAPAPPVTPPPVQAEQVQAPPRPQVQTQAQAAPTEPVSRPEPVQAAPAPAPQAPQPSQSAEKPKEILAEKYQGRDSINDNIEKQMKQSGVTTRVSGQPIESIARNIGINDRFLIIKELFEGDPSSYNALIDNLERSADFNEAFHYIEDQLADRMEHDGTQILVNLVRRKYIRGGNV